MPRKLATRHREPVIARLVVDLVRTLANGVLKDECFGARATDVILCCSVQVGAAERKPMTAAKLAVYAGIPRATVVRRLKCLEDSGILKLNEKRAAEFSEPLQNDQIIDTLIECRRLIAQAGEKVSKMDTHPIATKTRQ